MFRFNCTRIRWAIKTRKKNRAELTNLKCKGEEGYSILFSLRSTEREEDSETF